MNRQSLALCGASAAAVVLAAGPVHAQTVPAPGAPAQPAAGQADSAAERARDAQTSATVSELIVTAQKREEVINDVPLSVTAASGEKLTELVHTDASQLDLRAFKAGMIILTIAPILLIYPLILRYFTKGTMTGAVKG